MKGGIAATRGALTGSGSSVVYKGTCHTKRNVFISGSFQQLHPAAFGIMTKIQGKWRFIDLEAFQRAKHQSNTIAVVTPDENQEVPNQSVRIICSEPKFPHVGY